MKNNGVVYIERIVANLEKMRECAKMPRPRISPLPELAMSGRTCFQLNRFEALKTCVVCSEFVRACNLRISLPCPARVLDIGPLRWT